MGSGDPSVLQGAVGSGQWGFLCTLPHAEHSGVTPSGPHQAAGVPILLDRPAWPLSPVAPSIGAPTAHATKGRPAPSPGRSSAPSPRGALPPGPSTALAAPPLLGRPTALRPGPRAMVPSGPALLEADHGGGMAKGGTPICGEGQPLPRGGATCCAACKLFSGPYRYARYPRNRWSYPRPNGAVLAAIALVVGSSTGSRPPASGHRRR